jgi:hypothetical protein
LPNLFLLEDLLSQVPLDERIDSVYTDGAYDTKHCQQVILNRDAHAVIPSRKNAKPWKDQQVRSIERNELLKTVKLLGRSLWKKSGLVIIVEVWWKPRCIASNY